MSGGGYTPPEAPARPRTSADCANLKFTCVLNGVDPAVLSTVAVGSVCEVSLSGVPPTQVLAVLTPAGDRLGSIVDRWAELIACIERGVEFTAKIEQRTGPVRVYVAPK